MRRNIFHFLLALLVGSASLFVSAPTTVAQSPEILVPGGFVVETVTEGLEAPTGFDFAPDGRIFVTEKAGRVRVIQNGQLLPTPFIDVSDRINTVGDRGLLSVAVHPRFPAVPWLWLAYVYEPPEAAGHADSGARVSRVVRVQANPANSNVALPGSEVVVLGAGGTFARIGNPDELDAPPYTCYDAQMHPVQDCVPNEGPTHSVGSLRFGPDGALWIASGDGINYGWGSLRAQDVNNLAGKYLRVDPMTGRGLASNPFYDGNPDSNASKVYALGMKNPWKFGFHPVTGILYGPDVGNHKYEEINRVPPGANLGWPCFEGPRPNAFDPECDPVLNGEWPVTHAYYAYEHESGGRGAAMGGDFPGGNNFPAGYRNNYFYAEFNVATVERLYEDASGAVHRETFASGIHGPVEVRFGPDGALYVLSVYLGHLYRIRYTGEDNRPPVAVASASPTGGSAPLRVQFTGARSHEPDGEPITFAWDFGDGNTSSAADPTHTYSEEGRYTATLTVTDHNNARSTASVTIEVGNEPPTVQILSPGAETLVAVGDTVPLVGNGSDAEDGELSGDSLTWDAVLHHNEHVHYDFFEGSGRSAGFTYVDHGDNTYYEICLTATDSKGATAQDCVDVKAAEVVYTITSVPGGLPVTYDGTPYTTPFKVRTHVGATRRLSAPPTAQGNLRFESWSDGGERVHDLTIGSQDQTLTVRYVDADGTPAADEGDAGAVVSAEIVNAVESSPPVREQNEAPEPVTAEASPPPAAAAGSGTGRILREYWTGVSGKTIDDLKESPDYPDNPSGREYLPVFETARTMEPDYGSRIRGYIHPPVTGVYKFYIASDDHSGLWLSSDEDPANAIYIAGVPNWSGMRDWEKSPEQVSGHIRLEAGKKYYVEAIHKQADGKDNLAVAWQMPGRGIEVIDGSYLSPYEP